MILGHDDPTMIRMLYDLTGIDPTKVPLDDKETMRIYLQFLQKHGRVTFRTESIGSKGYDCAPSLELNL